MAGEREYLRIPPDSTGKRVRMVHGTQISYTNKTSGYSWKLDRTDYQFEAGWLFHVHTVHELTLTTGVLDVSYSTSAMFENLTPAVGDDIRDPDTGAVIAQVSGVTDVYINANNIIGYENPSHGLEIDNSGSANVRFSEGVPQLDAFGKLRVSGATILGEYVFSNGVLPTQFSSTRYGGGSVSWDSNNRALLLATTTGNDSQVSYTSNTYHHYYPGSSHLFIGTFALGDTGKTNLIREWGMFDDQNGFFFLQDGPNSLNVVVRSNTTGTVSDIIIPQAQWNKDEANGTGPSSMTLDVTKDNIYWIDVQWLGAGRARFGTYYDGQRVVLHEYYHGNNFSGPITATGSLPVCVHQHNEGATGSSSEMRSWCMAIWTESTLDITGTAKTALHAFNRQVSTNNTYVYMGTLAPKELLPNGNANRTLYWPTELEASGWDTVTGAPAIFELEIYAEPIISGFNWKNVSSSDTVEYDTSGTFISSGIALSQRFVQGKDIVDGTRVFNNMQYGAFKNYSEDGGTVVQPITNITNSSTAVVTLAGPRTYFRNSEPMTITGVNGMTQINSSTYYAKPITYNSVELYTNEELTTPVNSNGYSVYTSGGTATGTFGPKFHFGIMVKKLFGTNTATIYVKVAWKEVVQ